MSATSIITRHKTIAAPPYHLSVFPNNDVLITAERHAHKGAAQQSYASALSSSDDDIEVPSSFFADVSDRLTLPANLRASYRLSVRTARDRAMFHYNYRLECYGFELDEYHERFKTGLEWKLHDGKGKYGWETVPLGWGECCIERPVRYLFERKKYTEGKRATKDHRHEQVWGMSLVEDFTQYIDNKEEEEVTGDGGDEASEEEEIYYKSLQAEEESDDEWESAQEKTETLSKRDVGDREVEAQDERNDNKRVKWSGKRLAESVYDEVYISEGKH